jgi:hypothetical protein
MSIGILIVLALAVFVLCVVVALATGVVRVRVDMHLHCDICGREIPPGSYQRSVLFEQLRSESDELGGPAQCEHCAEGYPVIGRPLSSDC